MAQATQGWTDTDVESFMGNLLRVGVSAAAVLVAMGGVVFLIRHGTEPAGHHVFRGEPSDLREPQGIMREAAALHGLGLIGAGVLLLIGTPVARVVFSVLAFARQRDWVYVGITLIVLAVLTYSLLSGSEAG